MPQELHALLDFVVLVGEGQHEELFPLGAVTVPDNPMPGSLLAVLFCCHILPGNRKVAECRLGGGFFLRGGSIILERQRDWLRCWFYLWNPKGRRGFCSFIEGQKLFLPLVHGRVLVVERNPGVWQINDTADFHSANIPDFFGHSLGSLIIQIPIVVIF